MNGVVVVPVAPITIGIYAIKRGIITREKEAFTTVAAVGVGIHIAGITAEAALWNRWCGVTAWGGIEIPLIGTVISARTAIV